MSEAMKQRYNLSQSEQKAIIGCYEKALQDLASKTSKMIEDLKIKAGKEGYKVINDLTSSSIKYYYDTLKNIMKINFNQWKNSDSCMHKIIEKMAAGEEAVITASRLEESLENKIDMMIGKVEEFKPSNAQPNIDPDVMDEIDARINKYLVDISNSYQTHIKKIDKGNDKNNLYSCIKGHVSATYQGAYEGYIVCVNQVQGISQNLKNRMKSISSQVDGMNVNMEKISKKKAQDTNNFPQPEFM